MIAQVVLDLPMEGSFDYIVPPPVENLITVGSRVRVSFGPKTHVGVVIGFSDQSPIKNLKPIKALLDRKPYLDSAQMQFAETFSRYYGCSIGEALFTIVRGCERQEVGAEIVRGATQAKLYVCPSGHYAQTLVSIIRPLASNKQKTLILVPDQFVQSAIERMVKDHVALEDYVIGSRSLVFRSFKDIALVVMIDEDNSSYKQEQSPMYETRQVLFMRSAQEKMDVVFVSVSPSVELADLVHRGKVKKIAGTTNEDKSILAAPQAVDLNTYKDLWYGILSPAVLSTIESNMTKRLKSILVFNHKGSYAVTRCTECDLVMKCERCHSAMFYSKAKKKYLCRHCIFSLSVESICPHCKKPSWKSFGIGIEQLQKALLMKFPQAKIATFERGLSDQLGSYDILIGTVALLRFQYQIQVQLVALLDIDGELNRMDIRSCFHAWSVGIHFRAMAQGQFLIQTRNRDHYVVRALTHNDPEIFYREDMRIRKELGLSPFGHQVTIHLRSVKEPLVEKAAQELYQALIKQLDDKQSIQVHAPLPELVAQKRGQYRLNILVQGKDVVDMIAFIRAAMTKTKRPGRVIVVLNVDP